jgi:hypothetical protein
VEALDAEACLRHVFDDQGQRFVIDWIKPNRRGWVGVTNGEYRLIPTGEPDVAALLAVLEHTGPRAFPRSDQSFVEGLVARLLARG